MVSPKFLSPGAYWQIVTVWIALTVGGIGMGFIVWHRLNASLDATMENARFKLELDTIHDLLQDAETGQQGFLLTGNESFLASFHRAEAAIPHALDEIAEMAKDNTTLLMDVRGLRSLVAVKLADLGRRISARRDHGLEAALAIAPTARAEAANERFRTLIARMNRRPQDLFFVHSEETRKEIQRALVTTIAAGLVGFGTGLLAFYLSRLALNQAHEARQLAEGAARASRIAREKSAFLANMSHEIRTPMNAIVGFSDLLASTLPTDARAFHYASSIRESAQTLLKLINDILDLSKIEAGLVELHPEPTDVKELVGFVRSVFVQQAARKDLEFRVTVAPDVPATLLLDQSRLRQVLINLVGNALKFTQHGRVALRVAWTAAPRTRERGALLLEIADTGIGIPADRIEEIFKPSAPAADYRRDLRDGAGLGLSIVHRLVERMGGAVTIQSIVNQGSTVQLRFPDIAASAHPSPGGDRDDPEHADFNALAPAVLLVVDDNAVNRELLAGLFETTHHTLRYAANGREAVESVRHEIPSLVLMDIRMPEMDGSRAREEIHKVPGAETCPIIAVTASSMKEDEPALRPQFAGYVRKPYTRRQLFQAMAAFLPPQPAKQVLAAARTPKEAGGTAPLPIAETKDRWPALLHTLRQIKHSRWPAVRDSGAVFETREFARNLAELGRAAGCSRLVAYAASLARDAESYAVASLEKNLDEFPLVIDFIAEQSPASAP